MGNELIAVLVIAALMAGSILFLFWPLQGLFALICLRLLFENPPFLEGAKTTIITSAFGGLFILITVALKIFRRNFVVFTRPVAFFLIYLFVASLSFFNLERANDLGYLFFFLKCLSMPCMFLLTYNSAKNEKAGDRALLYFVLISIPPVIIGYLQLIFGVADHFSNFWGQRYDRIFSTFAHPNQFAFYLATVMFALMLMIQKKIVPKFAIIYSGIVVVAILLTYSRSVWLTLGICLAGVMISSRKLWIPACLVGVFLVIFMAPVILRGTTDILERQYGQFNSVDMRIKISKILMEKAFPQKPFFGFGLGTSTKIVQKYTSFQLPPHNDYTRIAIESGALGLIAFVVFLMSLFELPLTNPRLFLKNIYLRSYFFMITFLAVIIIGTNHLGNISTMGMWFALLGIVYKEFQLSNKSNAHNFI